MNDSKRFNKNAARTSFALILLIFVPMYFGSAYLQYKEFENGTGPSFSVWKVIKLIHDIFGTESLLILTCLGPVVGLILLINIYITAKRIRSEIGDEKFNDLKYQRVIESRKNSYLPKTPKHLSSKKEYQAYEKRVKYLFILMFIVFSLVGLGVITGVIA